MNYMILSNKDGFVTLGMGDGSTEVLTEKGYNLFVQKTTYDHICTVCGKEFKSNQEDSEICATCYF